jgi:predicted transcriptional regulator
LSGNGGWPRGLAWLTLSGSEMGDTGEKGMGMAGNSAEPGRSVTSKIVAILQAFTNGGMHSLTEIARLTELPVSTVHRLASELAVNGVLERTDDARYRVVVASSQDRQPSLLRTLCV